MTTPPSLKDNIELVTDCARFFGNTGELFAEISWGWVRIGQGIVPRNYHPLVDKVPDVQLYEFINDVGRTIAGCIELMPMHQDFIDRHYAVAAAA